MDMVVNSIGSTLNRASHIEGVHYSSSEAGNGSRISAPKTAADISDAILSILKCSLAEVESYLFAYESRLKLEEDYVRGLKTHLDRSRDALVKLDSRIASCMYISPGGAELPKARQAWKLMRDNTIRELDERTTYIQTLKHGVIAPLIAYRDSQERIRKRVKEDLKTSIERYEEMRHQTLPRARRMYEKKCDEVEQMRMQQQAIEDQRTLLSTPNASMSRQPSNPGSPKINSPRRQSLAISDGEGDHSPHGSPSSRSDSPRRAQSTRIPHRNNAGGAERYERSTPSATSSGQSPRMSGDGNLSLSPPQGDKKGHFLDALRSKENWDAARKEAPKKLNALISRMRESGNSDKGADGTIPIGSSNGEMGLGASLASSSGSIKSTQNIALKNVKAKREAEEADQIYRKTIFDLETLRLRREKTVSAAIVSVVDSRKELYITCQAVWLQAERASQTYSEAQCKKSDQSMQILNTSLDTLEREMKRVESRIPSLEEVDEGRVAYHNYYFGASKDLLFGVSLIDYAFNRAQYTAPSLGPGKVEAPLIVRKCIDFIEERGLTLPGIYRISAKHTAIQNLAHALEKDEERFEFNPVEDEPATVAGVLKLYLRQLPEAVMPIPWEERIKHTHERQEQIQNGFASLKSRIRRLPAINQATLKTIVEHLAKVASYSEQNKMTASNLSIVFGPLLLSQADHETTSIAAAMEEDRVTEDLVLYCRSIFDLSHAGAPILPPLNNSSNAVTLDNGEVMAPSDANGTLLVPLQQRQPTVRSSNSDTPLMPLDRSASLTRSNAIVSSPSIEQPVQVAGPRPYSIDPLQKNALAARRQESTLAPLEQTYQSSNLSNTAVANQHTFNTNTSPSLPSVDRSQFTQIDASEMYQR